LCLKLRNSSHKIKQDFWEEETEMEEIAGFESGNAVSGLADILADPLTEGLFEPRVMGLVPQSV
jgi:hypothetical protein